MEIEKQISRAFKKLKANIYYDKTQSILCQQLVEYESERKDTLENRFIEIGNLLCGSSKRWENYQSELLNSINMLCFPKKVKESNSDVIMNFSNEDIEIDSFQYFISLSVEGHLLGVLWILLIGTHIDKNIYEHSYGNRLRSNVFDEEKSETSFSPYLFKPYFSQYESWRDIGLNYAQKNLNNDIDIIF